MKENKSRSSSHSSSSYDRSDRGERNSRSDSYDAPRRDSDRRHGHRNYDSRSYDSRPKSSRLSFYLGQIFGLVYNLAVLRIVYLLVQNGNQQMALKVFVINAFVMIFAISISAVDIKFFRRNNDRRFSKRR